MQHPGEGVGPEACAKTAQTSTCIHTKRRVALYRFGHSSVPCRQRPIPHPAGPSIADFEETQPSHMQAQWSPRKPIGRTPNVILAKSRAHQEAARRSIKNSTISDSIVRGRALRVARPMPFDDKQAIQEVRRCTDGGLCTLRGSPSGERVYARRISSSSCERQPPIPSGRG